MGEAAEGDVGEGAGAGHDREHEVRGGGGDVGGESERADEQRDVDDASAVVVTSVLSRPSYERLGEELDAEIDPRRFRMLFELDGCDAHEEDGWSGRLVRFGDAVLRIGGPVPRCAITTQDPDTGIRSLDTLRGIKSYRGLRDGRAIDFGVYAEVERPGRVRVGDAVTVL